MILNLQPGYKKSHTKLLLESLGQARVFLGLEELLNALEGGCEPDAGLMPEDQFAGDGAQAVRLAVHSRFDRARRDVLCRFVVLHQLSILRPGDHPPFLPALPRRWPSLPPG